ncbi:hypothetical protein F4778DRAFT_755219 [Xylariomycetidae sp. FL2044]|nr:hypothetical protein F4778DRAFT_755219 [Xylariomycetidae sp. FL2044]
MATSCSWADFNGEAFEHYFDNLNLQTITIINTPNEPIPRFLQTNYSQVAKMVQMYTVLGRQVGSHHLAMGVLGALFGGSYLATRGPKKQATQTPPINASSPDEADFIQCALPIRSPRDPIRLITHVRNFLKQADEGEKKAKH